MKAKQSFEQKIKELEEQIELLRNQSGDLVSQLQAKIKEMQQNFDREKTEMELSHEQARKELLQLHENQMSATKQDYEEKL